MRVLLSCLQSRKRHPLPAYDFWRPYFVEGLREAGFECAEVPEVDWVEGLTCGKGEGLEAWRERTWEAVLAFVRREHARRPLNLFIGYLYPAQVLPEAIVELQRMGIPCVNFFCDNVREFRGVPPEYHPFALHWVPEFEALPMYRRAGLPHIHAPMPCWVPHELRCLPDAETRPPTFIGSADILRRDLLGRALHAGADIVLQGAGWAAAGDAALSQPIVTRSASTLLANQWDLVRTHGLGALARKVDDRLRPLDPPPVPPGRVGPPVVGADYLKITREAMVAIGVNRVATPRASNRRPLTYSRLRDIEAPMVGACYLTEWTAGLAELYDLGAEVETYRTAEELAAKLGELQADPARRRGMRQKAQQRALGEHSVARSLKRIARELAGERAP